MKYVCALFVVDDIEKAKEFYVKILGQKIKNDFGENVIFEGGFALHKKDHFKELIGNLPIKNSANSSELYFEDDHLLELQNKLMKEKIEFIHKVREQPWRQRVLRFFDLDRNIVEVGESLEYLAYRLWTEGIDEKEVGKITNMGTEFVKKTIKNFE